MNAPTPALSLTELTAHIASLEQQRSNIPAVDLQSLENTIQHHAARQSVGTPAEQAEHKTKLLLAVQAKEEAQTRLERLQAIDGQLARLRQDLEVAQYANEQASKTMLANELAEACNEFVTIAKQLVRSYRRCHRLAARNRALGAPARLPESVDMSLRFLSSAPYGGVASIGQEMEFGLLPFETREQREAAK